MFEWRAFSLFAAVVAASAITLGPSPAVAQRVDDRDDSPRAGADRSPSPDVDREGDASPAEPDSVRRQELPERARPRQAALPDDVIEDALRHGRSEKGKNQGLVIRDAGRGWMNALNALADEPTQGSGFWIEVYTPESWIAQLGSDAAKQYRDISLRDLDPEDLAAVLRVTVHPDMPDRVSRRGMRLSSGVERVVVRPRGRKDARVLQPLSVSTFDETAVGRHGREATFSGVQAIFDLRAVIEVIGQSRDREFDVIVIGEGDREKTFGVKKKHFDRLPGLPRF